MRNDEDIFHMSFAISQFSLVGRTARVASAQGRRGADMGFKCFVRFGVVSWIIFVAALDTIHQITLNNTKHLNLSSGPWRTWR
jgi:hypothetical protein